MCYCLLKAIVTHVTVSVCLLNTVAVPHTDKQTQQPLWLINGGVGGLKGKGSYGNRQKFVSFKLTWLTHTVPCVKNDFVIVRTKK